MASHHYFLPNHSSLTSLDPLGICEDGEDPVNHLVLLKALLNAASEAFTNISLHTSTAALGDQRKAWRKIFITLFQDISYSLHGEGSLPTAGLEEYLSNAESLDLQELERLRKALFNHALHLDDSELSFANGTLDQLSTERPSVQLGSTDTDTLLAHMLLGTFSIPHGNTWGRPGFTELFSRPSATAHAYLHTLFKHFAEGAYSKMTPSMQLASHLHNASTIPDLKTCELPTYALPTKIVPIPFENSPPDYTATTSRFLLVAAHSQPGPGPNGTQEERLVGQSPTLALLSLLKPALGPDEAIITSKLPAHSSWEGHGRQARMTQLFDSRKRPLVSYIVADALELDVEDRSDDGILPDLRPGNVQREVKKLFAAFSGAKAVHAQDLGAQGSMRIEVPPWGCGAFGGNLRIKVQCMMMAAALAGLDARNVELVVGEDRASELEALPKKVESVREMFARLSAASKR